MRKSRQGLHNSLSPILRQKCAFPRRAHWCISQSGLSRRTIRSTYTSQESREPRFGEIQVNSSGHEERLRTGSDPSTVGCVGHGFLRSDRGTALIEYALLLGALVCAVIAGIHFGGLAWVIRLMGICLECSLRVMNRSRARNCKALTSPRASLDRRTQAGKAERIKRYPDRASAYLAVALLVIFLWRIAWRRRTRRRSSEKETAIERTEDRLQMKRRVLWRNILEDPRLLFKNRVEVRHLMTRDVTGGCQAYAGGRTPSIVGREADASRPGL